jgi:thioredoxin 1
VLRRCPTCGRENRIPARHLAHAGRCGQCKQQLAPLDQPLEVDPPAFDEIVVQSPVPVLVDFWAPWCGPCRMVSPILEEINAEREDLRVVKLNVDDNQATAIRYEVLSIPTMILFKDGEIAKKLIGAQPKARIEAELEPALA